MCLSGRALSENTEFTSYSRHIQAEETLFLIQTWKDNTIGYIRALSGLTEGPGHRPLLPPPPAGTFVVHYLQEHSYNLTRSSQTCSHTTNAGNGTLRTCMSVHADLKRSLNYQVRRTLMSRGQNESLKVGNDESWREVFDIHSVSQLFTQSLQFLHIFITDKIMGSSKSTEYHGTVT